MHILTRNKIVRGLSFHIHVIYARVLIILIHMMLQSPSLDIDSFDKNRDLQAQNGILLYYSGILED